MAKDNGSEATEAQESTGPRIDWDDTSMQSSYANVCNVQGTREEFVLLFGISHPSQSGEPQVKVRLSDRVILSPFAAKRLALLLQNTVQAYEQRFGALQVGAEGAPSSETAN